MKVTNQPILLVEDDQVDAMSVIRALKEVHVTNPVVHAENGKEALNYLENVASDRPCLILLDLNMPIMNGIEFLRILRGHKKLRAIPVVALTMSNTDESRLSSFNLGVAGYMVKPANYRQLVEVIRSIDAYWTISEMQ